MRKFFGVPFSVVMTLVVLTLLFAVFSTRPTSTTALGIAEQATSFPEANASISPAYPPPATPTDAPTSPPLSTPTPDLVVPSPTIFPTTSAKLPTGSKIIFAETTGVGLTIWAASAADTSERVILSSIEHSIEGYNISVSSKLDKLAVVATNRLNSRTNGELLVVQTGTGKVNQLASNVALGRYQNYPAWSPDGQFIAILRQSTTDVPYSQTVSIINAESGEEQVVAKSEISTVKDEASATIYPLDWSPDGRYLYFQKGSFGAVELWRFDISSQATEKVNDISYTGIPRCYYVSFDGAYLLCLSSSDDLTLYSVNLISTTPKGEQIALTNINAEEFSDPIWSPNSNSIAMGIYDPTLKRASASILNAQDGAVTRVSFDNSAISNTSSFPIAWSPDGKWLLVQTVGSAQTYYVADISGKGTTELILPLGTTIVGWTIEELPK